MHAKPLLFIIGLVSFLSISMWTPPVIISTHPDNISYANSWPEMAVDAAGNTSVVWQGSDGNDEEIYWVRVDAEGTPGQVQKISTHLENETHNDYYPQISIDSFGNSYITWFGSDGNDTEIYWVKIDSSGELGVVEKISPRQDGELKDDLLPQIAVDAVGNSYVTWHGFDGNDYDIYWVRIDSMGAQEEVVKISTHLDNIYNDSDPQIAIDESGNSYVVWQGCDKENCWDEPGDLEIYWVKIDPEGIPGTVKKIPPTDPDNVNTTPMKPQMAVDAQGNTCIVWSGMNEESVDVYWVRIDSSGELGTIQRISAHSDLHSGDYEPRICVDAEGNSYVAWCGSEEKYGEIYWVRIDSSGTLGSVLKISNYLGSTLCDDSNPQIAVDSSKNSYVTWESYNMGSAEQFDHNICFVKIDADADPGRVQNISTYPTSKHFDRNSRIIVDSKGNSYIVWEGHDASKHDHIFFTSYLINKSFSIAMTIMIPLVIVIMVIVVVMIRKKTK